jgi:hypothetical protein
MAMLRSYLMNLPINYGDFRYEILLALIAIIGHNMTINGGVIYVYKSVRFDKKQL